MFDGGTGNNQIYDSGTGNDTLIGGVGSGNDTLVVSDFPHTATLDASGETGSSSLYAAGSGNDTLIGGIGNDTLTTADFAGTSSLSGGAGNDSLSALGSGFAIRRGWRRFLLWEWQRQPPV